MPVSHIPAGYHTITPYITVRGGREGARVLQGRVRGHRDHAVRHAGRGPSHTPRSRSGGSRVMLGDEMPAFGNRGPESLGGNQPAGCASTCRTWTRRSPEPSRAGGKEFKPVADQFYGDRSGTVLDPFGTCGRCPRTSKTYRSRRCSAGARKLMKQAA